MTRLTVFFLGLVIIFLGFFVITTPPTKTMEMSDILALHGQAQQAKSTVCTPLEVGEAPDIIKKDVCLRRFENINLLLSKMLEDLALELANQCVADVSTGRNVKDCRLLDTAKFWQYPLSLTYETALQTTKRNYKEAVAGYSGKKTSCPNDLSADQSY